MAMQINVVFDGKLSPVKPPGNALINIVAGPFHIFRSVGNNKPLAGRKKIGQFPVTIRINGISRPLGSAQCDRSLNLRPLVNGLNIRHCLLKKIFLILFRRWRRRNVVNRLNRNFFRFFFSEQLFILKCVF